MPKRLSILDVLESVTDDDLAEIDTMIADHQKKLDGLTEARKLISVKLHGKPASPLKGKKKSAAAVGSNTPMDKNGLAAKAAKVLGAKGPMSIVKLAEAVDAKYNAVYAAVRSSQGFAQGPDGVTITPEGKQLYGV